MNKSNRILIIGGGFAGTRVAQDLSKAGFDDVTLIDRKDYFEVTYSTLRTLTEPAMGERARMRYADFIKSGFRQGEVTELTDGSARLADGSEIPFDIAVIATGSSYKSFQIAKSYDAIDIADRTAQMAAEHERLAAAKNVLIIGGGPVGVELAGEIADHFPGKSVTLAEKGDRLLGDLKPKASRITERQLKSLGVNVLFNAILTNEDAAVQKADIVYTCVGLVPNTEFMKANFASSLDQSCWIKVGDTLRMEGSDNIYAIGDCASTPDVKFGYVADSQGALLAKNLEALAMGKPTKRFKTPPLMSLVPAGRSEGLVQLAFVVTTCPLLVNMKQKDMFIARQYGNLGVRR